MLLELRLTTVNVLQLADGGTFVSEASGTARRGRVGGHDD